MLKRILGWFKSIMNNERDDEDNISLAIPIFVAIGVVAAWLLTLFLLKDVANRGTFGDMFGAINALFSGLAFVGVVFAILFQSNELKLQRRELKLTRGEFRGQKLQLKAQNETLKKQNFENTFFELLRLQNDITNAIDWVDGSGRPSKGRDCFKVFYVRFTSLWAKDLEKLRGTTEVERINNTYKHFYEGFQSEFGHYFRSMYNILKFIDNSPVEDKRLYTNLVRAQLSSFELTLLFYNSLSELGCEKFKPLIEKYSLLKTVSRSTLIDPSHLSLYLPQAYGGSPSKMRFSDN